MSNCILYSAVNLNIRKGQRLPKDMEKTINLNVGGKVYETSKETLEKVRKESPLCIMTRVLKQTTKEGTFLTEMEKAFDMY